MSRTNCPHCGCRIGFRKFLQLNNFSVANCDTCNARFGISNRSANAVIAGISGVLSAAAVVMGAYFGDTVYQSMFAGLFSGLLVAVALITGICMYAYRHSRLNRIHADN